MMKATVILAGLILSLAIASTCSFSQSTNQNNPWFQFRGENANGIADENARPPVDFGPEKNVLWKIETPEGYSSPIIVNDNLIITGVDRQERKYLTININPGDGGVKWIKEVIADTLEVVHPLSSPASATPASDGNYIYCFFPSFGLVCYDLDGNDIWEHKIPFQKVVSGSGTSPVIIDDKLILNYDNLIEPRILAFNKSNGTLLWTHHFPRLPLVNGSSWSTPVVWKNQIAIHRSNSIEGLDINSGNSAWHFSIGSIGEATPVIIEDTLYVNSWGIRGEESLQGEIKDFEALFKEIDNNSDGSISRDEFDHRYPGGMAINQRTENDKDLVQSTFYLFWWSLAEFDQDKDQHFSEQEWKGLVDVMVNSSNHGVVAIRLGGTSNITLTSQLWKMSEDIPETSSVLVRDGRLYMVRNGGTVTCLNAENGEVIYRNKLGASGAYFSSPLYADGKIYFASFNGKITVIKAGPEFEIISQADLDEKIGASPVAINDRLYIRTANHLYAFARGGEN